MTQQSLSEPALIRTIWAQPSGAPYILGELASNSHDLGLVYGTYIHVKHAEILDRYAIIFYITSVARGPSPPSICLKVVKHAEMFCPIVQLPDPRQWEISYCHAHPNKKYPESGEGAPVSILN